MKNVVEIALAADGGYFDQLFVTATSMAAYCQTDAAVLSFHILDGGIRDEDWGYLVQKVTELHPRSSFNKIPVDQGLFEKFPSWNGNRMAYARLILPEVLKDKDWVLYSDCDFLWLRDVAELWKERDGGFAVMAVLDPGSWENKERDWFSRNGYRKDGAEYFCSGMCLFNLSFIRKYGIIEKTNKVLEQHADVPYVDQTALNVSCAGVVKLIDPQWMRFTHQLTLHNHALPSVIHHAGEVPWKFVRKSQPLSDTMLLWHRFNARIRGIGLWKSLRRYFSPHQIVFHRAIAILSRFWLTRGMIWLACKMSGHMGAYPYFTMRGVQYLLPEPPLARWQIVSDFGNDFHAGPKAQRDVAAILSNMGWRPFVVRRWCFKGWLGRWLNRLGWLFKCYWLRRRLPSNCTLFMQYQSAAWSVNPSLRVINAAIKQRKNIRLFVLFHDLASLRWNDDSLENGHLARDEADLLALADRVVVHNAEMKAALVRRGIHADKMVVLEIFDYLTDCEPKTDRAFENSVVIAGNLNPDKAGYLEGLSSILGIEWKLYGVHFDSSRMKGSNVRFYGCYSPEELPSKLEGSFGLVWDGTSIESCKGALGNYLRINNPHKLSLYLVSGLPIVIWKGAAEARFVRENGLGIEVESLVDLPSVLSQISADDYRAMIQHVREVSLRLRNGENLKRAIENIF